MRIFSIALLVFIALSTITLSQSSYTNVFIHGDFNDGYSPEEPSICINPKNLNQIVAGTNLDIFYYSSNGGTSWTSGILNSSYSVWGDPAMIVDTIGNFFFIHLTYLNGNLADRIVLQKSTDGGASYSDGTFFGLWRPQVEDKAWGCVDRSHGPQGNWIYVTWTRFSQYEAGAPDSSQIMFARSSDDGATWGDTIQISKKAGNAFDSDGTDEGAVPCIGPNGEVYDGWAGYGNYLYFQRSTDGGNTWLAHEIKAGYQPGGWDMFPSVNGVWRCNGLPITCCDVSSGPYRGRIYINYADSISPNAHDIKIIRSTDGGSNWSSPIRVNDDPAGKEHFFTWLTIDQVTGYLYDVFYDRRNYTDAETDVYVAHSTDGGSTWINERVSASPFTPNTGRFFGDYNNITAYNGVVRPIWTRQDGNALSVYTAIMNFPLAIAQITGGVPKQYSLSQNYPNPFNPTTKINFSIPPSKGVGGMNGAEVFLRIYDVLGREVTTLISQQLNSGTYEVTWDASNFASGVYFYTLEATPTGGQAGAFKETKKLMLMK